MVHPHACGELIFHGEQGKKRFWFIPTHVGNSSFLTIYPLSPSVHPHACGELDIEILRVAAEIGSSPRMWGTQVLRDPVFKSPRFIPTHVGNSPSVLHIGDTGSVHPHACGELSTRMTGPSRRVGSSPRMWGTLSRADRRNSHRWFIPTHVGNSRLRTL